MVQQTIRLKYAKLGKLKEGFNRTQTVSLTNNLTEEPKFEVPDNDRSLEG